MAKRLPLTEQLRREIRSCGLSVYRVAKDCDIAEPQLHNFLHGKSGLGMAKIDRLAEYLGLKLCRTRKVRTGPKRS